MKLERGADDETMSNGTVNEKGAVEFKREEMPEKLFTS